MRAGVSDVAVMLSLCVASGVCVATVCLVVAAEVFVLPLSPVIVEADAC